MKKIILLLGVFLLINISCEKDDFCLKNPVTPNLVLRFFDNLNIETIKSVDALYVWAEGKDTIFEFNGQNKDSIFIPLNSLDTLTVYKFSNGTNVNTFTIQYTPEEEYISRSCGFRVIYNDLSFSSDSTWIMNFIPTTRTINNQNAAHVQLFH